MPCIELGFSPVSGAFLPSWLGFRHKITSNSLLSCFLDVMPCIELGLSAGFRGFLPFLTWFLPYDYSERKSRALFTPNLSRIAHSGVIPGIIYAKSKPYRPSWRNPQLYLRQIQAAVPTLA